MENKTREKKQNKREKRDQTVEKGGEPKDQTKGRKQQKS